MLGEFEGEVDPGVRQTLEESANEYGPQATVLQGLQGKGWTVEEVMATVQQDPKLVGDTELLNALRDLVGFHGKVLGKINGSK